MIRAIRAEWTKLMSVRSTAVALLAVFSFTVLIGYLSAQGGHGNANDAPRTVDHFSFVHRELSGDGSVTARVAQQKDSAPWAKSGVVIKASTVSGSSYVALMVTPDHGVRMLADAKTEATGEGDTAAPVWLRLTRAGREITGYESADGRAWRKVGTLTARALPARAQAGLFVASHGRMHERLVGPGEIVGGFRPTTGQAVFDHVTLAPAGASAPDDWTLTDVAEAPVTHGPPAEIRTASESPGTLRRAGGTFTVTGSGDLGRIGIAGVGSELHGFDRVKDSLSGAQFGMIAAIALGVLAMTSEYRTGTIRTTFGASPRRARVLAAKAVVLAGTVFPMGLAAAVTTLLLTRPIQRRNGMGPPVNPDPSLSDPTVLRAVVGTAATLALVALLSLGVGVLLRRTAGAVILLFGVFLVVPIVAQVSSVDVNNWVNRATPIAGLAIRQTMHLLGDSTSPWGGFAVLCGYTAVALGAAFWVQGRRDA
ncbi:MULTISPECIES: ABC transporter permease subunit [unclassified Streptomyces]|uniref:ABC transporter permease subunit n=1 Tax=unclassified Streptomyces TaxID=2593676 RepID=UPI0033E63C35